MVEQTAFIFYSTALDAEGAELHFGMIESGEFVNYNIMKSSDMAEGDEILLGRMASNYDHIRHAGEPIKALRGRTMASLRRNFNQLRRLKQRLIVK